MRFWMVVALVLVAAIAGSAAAERGPIIPVTESVAAGN